jgi:hypothetical protein
MRPGLAVALDWNGSDWQRLAGKKGTVLVEERERQGIPGAVEDCRCHSWEPTALLSGTRGRRLSPRPNLILAWFFSKFSIHPHLSVHSFIPQRCSPEAITLPRQYLALPASGLFVLKTFVHHQLFSRYFLAVSIAPINSFIHIHSSYDSLRQ